MVVPYFKGVSESLKKICGKHGVQVYFKGGHTIKSLLVAPKDQDPILKKSGVIYRYTCGRVDCNEEYIGESSRTFGERFKEHQKAPSPIYDHSNITGHQVTIDNFNIVRREYQNLSRAIKEALHIRANNPSLNRNIRKYHLPHIWDEVLLNTSELKIEIRSRPMAITSATMTKSPCSGYSICHQAITSAITLIAVSSKTNVV